jgi:DNA invertase Pin-like site-specific DNA recombinase
MGRQTQTLGRRMPKASQRLCRQKSEKRDQKSEALRSLIRLAYPYLRYSDPKQEDGDSERRQGDWHEQVCREEGWQIDLSFPLVDKGKSAYHGEHLKAALGKFLAAVNGGRIQPGSVLLVEELDRLDRRAKKLALPFIIGLLTAGIWIRTRDRLYTEDSLDNLGELLDIIVKVGGNHEESRKKSERVKANWDRWRALVTAGKKAPPPGRLPPWITWAGDDFALKKGPATALALAVKLAGDGLRIRDIVRRFETDGVPAIGHSGAWTPSYLAKLFNWPALLGEFQDGFGNTYPRLFPPVCSKGQLERARLALASRRLGLVGVGRRGRGDYINVFAGLLTNAADGSRLYLLDTGGSRYLVGAAALAGLPDGVPARFPAQPFEQMVLALFREIDPKTILGHAREPDLVLTLSQELARAEAAVKSLEADLEEHGDSPALYRRLRRKEAQARQLAADLAAARARAAHPMSERWGEALAALELAPHLREARQRLRAAMAGVLEQIHCLFVPRGHGRVLAAVQCRFIQGFAQGGVRDYLLSYKAEFASGKHRRPARCEARSLPRRHSPLDLRRPADVKKLRRELERIALEDPHEADASRPGVGGPGRGSRRGGGLGTGAVGRAAD